MLSTTVSYSHWKALGWLFEQTMERGVPASVGARTLNAIPPKVRAFDRTSVKLVTLPDTGNSVAKEVEKLGGKATSIGSQVIVADIPRPRLKDHNKVKNLRRAEEPRRLRFSMDLARRPQQGRIPPFNSTQHWAATMSWSE